MTQQELEAKIEANNQNTAVYIQVSFKGQIGLKYYASATFATANEVINQAKAEYGDTLRAIYRVCDTFHATSPMHCKNFI